MRIFISWSGEGSLRVAKALRDFLPSVIQSVQPWLSSDDIEAGDRWSAALSKSLDNSQIAIVCLTRESLKSAWINFEVGQLAKKLESRFVVPLLIDFPPSDLEGPLIQFQAIRPTKDEIFNLLSLINRSLGKDGLSESTLERSFDVWWPTLDQEIQNVIESETSKQTKAPTTDLVESIEKLSPEQFSRLSSLVAGLSGGSPSQEGKEEDHGEPGESVFLVHGRDHGTMERVARFLERINLDPIILHEQANEGRTIIEKFEVHSDVSYAVILLTPDDKGGLATDSESQQLRARQNVVLELGYFIGKLGRNRVSVLKVEKVEKPSDIDGMVYIGLDGSDGWKIQLAREFKVAGLKIDPNGLL